MRNLSEIADTFLRMVAEVRRQLGPGLRESTYEAALCVELDEAGLRYRRRPALPILYKGRPIGDFQLDLVIEDAIAVGIRSTGHREPTFPEQVLTTLRIAGHRLGLWIDFNAGRPREGVTRVVL